MSRTPEAADLPAIADLEAEIAALIRGAGDSLREDSHAARGGAQPTEQPDAVPPAVARSRG
jgi:hypothetical protein